jgi:hypothetical protein
MIAKRPRVSALGFDTIEVITAAHLAELEPDPRVEFIGRYVDGLTAYELDAILATDRMVTLFTYADEFNPAPRIAELRALGIPPSTTIWLDVEGVTQRPDVQINTWAAAMRAAGYDPGAYVGAQSLLTASDWSALSVDRYCRSCSLVPEPVEGFCLLQLSPPNQKIGTLVVDWLVVQADYHGRLPSMISAGQ